jgi:predicted CoA-binding protein
MKTVIIGASPNTDRTAYQAAQLLEKNGIDFVPVGIKSGLVLGKNILTKDELKQVQHVHTVTMYVRPDLQADWYDPIMALKPARIIFNPGTENPEFESMATAKGIEAVEACTLVLLTTGQY